MLGPAFLRGDRVDLHTVEDDDVPFLQRLVNDPRVRETLGSILPYSERQQTAWFESLDPDSFAILVRADGIRSGTSSSRTTSRRGRTRRW